MIAILLLLLASTQSVTFLLVAAAERKYARQRVNAEIEEATRVFVQFVTQTVKQLALSVRLLSSDYGFSSTFAQLRNSDSPVARATLQSALENYRDRIVVASFIRLVSSEGQTIADTLPPAESAKLVMSEQLIIRAEETPGLQAARIETLGDTLHLVVVHPLLMPEPSVWIAVGFPLDAPLAAEFRRLSDFEIAFLYDGRVIASTPPLAQANLRFSPPEPKVTSALQTLDVKGKPFLGLTVPFPEDFDGKTAIAMLTPLEKEMAPFWQLEKRLILFNAAALLISCVAGILIAGGLTRPVVSLSQGVRRIMSGDYRVQVPVNTRDELGDLAVAFNSLAVGLEERDKVRDLLGRSVSPEVARELMRSKLALGGELRNVTILFSDLRDFTAHSETQSPEVLVEELNAYFTEVTRAVESAGGIVDKYIGDAVMAVFGAPVAVDDHADRAVRAALQILLAEEALNGTRGLAGLPKFRTGIGISTGDVVAGNVGSTSRNNYTVIGNEVNLASRLESLTKEARFRARIICSDTARLALTGAYQLRDLGETEIRGKKGVLRIWAVDSSVD
ncbi:MAG TPA: adenylate/guanylate cyclase domain-containing protein [Terrimicrobiaceae bacterium]